MATVLHAPSSTCVQPGPPPNKLHHRRSSAALHHRTMSFLSTSTSSSSLHSLAAASPSKPRSDVGGPPVRRQLHFGTRPSPNRRRPGGRVSSSSTSSDDELASSSPRASTAVVSAAGGRRPAYRLDTTSLPPSRIPVMSPSYRSPSANVARPAWGASPTKRSTSFSFNRPPLSMAKPLQPIFVPSPSSPLRTTRTHASSLLSPETAFAAADEPPISPASPSPFTSYLPPVRPLETGRVAVRQTPGSSTFSGSSRKERSPLTWHLDDSFSTLRRESAPSSRFLVDSSNSSLHSPFRSLSEGRLRAARKTPPPAYLLPQPQSQPPKPQPLQRIRGSFPSATSLASSAGSKSCVSPAGSTDSRASSSKLAFEDARPSPEAFKVSLMKKGQGSMHGLARSGGSTYQAPPTPNPKMSHRPVPHACADRSPHTHMSPSLSTIPRSAQSFLSHSLSCRRPPTSSLARSQQPPLAASWSAGSESSAAASSHSPAVSPRHKGAGNLAPRGKDGELLLPCGKAVSMAKIQAQSDFLLAVDVTMAESPERVNGLGFGLGLGLGLGIGLGSSGSGFPGFEQAALSRAAHKSSRSRSRRSGGIKRKGSHLDAPSLPAVSAFASGPTASPLSPPSFSVARQGGRPPLKRASYAEDVFGSKFEILGEVGRGMSGGVVYKALEKQSGVVAAVKVSPVYGGVRDRIRHLEEVDILRMLSKVPHASVVTLLSSWEQAGRLHIQTPLAAGGDLASFLSVLADSPSAPASFSASIGESPSAAGLDEGRTWKLLGALASGLAHIHSLGIIHLDIKPANVLITHDRHVILTDFGTATCWPRKRPSEILRGSGMGSTVVDELTAGPVWEEREGDRGYLSAEAVNGVVSPAGDVFSLGLLLLEALTNIIPPSNGDAWTRLRSDDFSDIEAPPASPALSSSSTFSPQLLDSAFSTRSCSSYLGAHSPLTESDTSSLLTPFGGGSTPGGSTLAGWASESLSTLVKQLMASDPARRPTANDLARHHPVLNRVRQLAACPPLANEGPAFLGQILADAGSWPRPSSLAPPFFAPPPPAASSTTTTGAKDSTVDLARDLEKMDVDVDLSC